MASSAKAPIAVADSVTGLGAQHAGAVIVTGSHGGTIAARYAMAARVRAAIFNDAGIGLDEAGVSGLVALASAGIAAVAVSHRSARIGDGADTLACGIVTRVNAPATACGVLAGMPCRDAAERLRAAPWPLVSAGASPVVDGRYVLRDASARTPAIVGLDSIGLVRPPDAACVLVIGSHGGLHGGDPRSALRVEAAAAYFHDAGRGKDDAGTTRLPVLASRGIAAGVVDAGTARIGDARSMWSTGVLSGVNAVLAARSIRPGMRLADAVARYEERGGRLT